MFATHLELCTPQLALSGREILPAHKDAHVVGLSCDDLPRKELHKAFGLKQESRAGANPSGS